GYRRHQPEVRVKPSGAVVVIARREMDVAADATARAAGDEQDLRVRLVVAHPLEHVCARLLPTGRPPDVGLFVEARQELDEDRDLLPALGGAREGANHG